tara:strand:- start:718 stop:963 length:246 start_codon:yes stop_codon:yes gene_type:complete
MITLQRKNPKMIQAIQYLPLILEIASSIKDLIDDDNNSATAEDAQKSLKKKLTSEAYELMEDVIAKDSSHSHKNLIEFLKG